MTGLRGFVLCALAGALVTMPARPAEAAVCRITVTDVAFGLYDVFAASDQITNGTIGIYCTDHVGSVRISLGPGVSGSFARAMAGAADRLLYNLFLDPGCSVIWGDGTSGTSVFTGPVERRTTLNVTVYGRAPCNQDVTPGTYSDSLTVTVDF